jgi:hypothetical protein
LESTIFSQGLFVKPQEQIAMQTTNDVITGYNTEPKVSAPSIASSAMLVEFGMSCWTGRKKDKRASNQVTRTNNASAGVANVSKKLLGDCAELEAVQKFVANTRNIHYAMTMPWSNMGLRLLPTAQYFKYHEQMTALQDEFNILVNTFLQEYDNEIINAQLKLGGLFDPFEYPTSESLRHKFEFRLSYQPLPESGDFRIDVGNEATEQMRTQYQEFYSTQLQNAMNDVWKRLYERLSNMSERLDYTDDNKKKCGSNLVTHVIDMVELLNVCNVTGDSQMSAMAVRLDEALRGVTIEALREDQHLRAETKRTVDDVIQSLPSLDF